jgi:hypothetical protein
MRMLTALTTLAAGAVAATLLAAPAQAATLSVTDPTDIHHGVDLQKVRVAHGEDRLRVTLTHLNLRRSPSTGASGTIFLDTDPDDRGPEYVFAAGLFEGTDYALLTTDGYAVGTWGEPVDCGYRMRLDYREEKTRTRFSRDCFGDPDSVRVAVKVAGLRTDGSTVVDWLGARRSVTFWVAQG